MIYRTFGRSDLEFSAISLGCWIFGVDWWGHRTQEDCDRMCAYALERGVTYFDNGDAYGNGRAEELFGNWHKSAGVDRSKIQIGGKFGYDFYTDPGTPGSHSERKQDFSARFMRKALEHSLRRLQTDYIDLYMAHNIKLPQFNDELFAELEKVKDEGKIRVWGVSLGPAIGWREEGFGAIIDHRAQAVQTVFNLFEQNPGHEFCEVANAYDAGVVARVHDNSSILKDVVKIDTQIDANDHRKFRDQHWKTFGLKKLDLIRHYAADHGMNVHELACKWLLQQKGLTSITGTFLSEQELQDGINATIKPDLNRAELLQIAEDYARDWGLGDDAHPCNLKSSTDPAGQVKSGYGAPPMMMA